MSSVSKMRIQIVNPALKRVPGRDITMRDIVTAPVDYTRGLWRVVDMLDQPSAIALMKAYNKVNGITV